MRSIYKLLVVLLLFATACKPEPKQKKLEVSQYLLPQTSYFIKLNKKKLLNKENPLFIDAYLSKNDKQFIEQAGFKIPFALNIFQNNSKIKGFIAVGKIQNPDSVFNGKTYTYEDKNIYQTTYNKQNYYGVTLNERILISNRKLLIENNIRIENDTTNAENNPLIQKGLASFDENAAMNIAVNINKIKPDNFYRSVLKMNLTDIGNWQFFDWVDVENPVASGINLSEENKSALLPAFQDVKPEKHEFGKYIPFASSENISISFDDFALFMNGLNRTKIYAPQKNSSNFPVLNSLKAINFFQENTNKAVLLKMENPDDFVSEETERIKEVNNFDIYQNTYPELINNYFSSLIPETHLKYFALNGQYLILSETQAYLEKILNDIQNHSCLSDSQLYRELQAEIPGSYHLILFKNKINIGGKNYMKAQTYHVEKPEIFTNLILESYSDKQQNETIIEQVLSYQLPEKPYLNPQLVYNHKTKSYNIIYQDTNDNLILINMKGKQLWKKKLKDKIIGNIKQVDILRNHKYQYAFVTPHHWYVVDRLGRDVEHFPKHFINKITQGLSLFDYEHNRKYRFGITQGKRFNLFDNQAKKIKGFKVKLKENILYPPEHFRIAHKDFILMQSEDGKLNLLNRRGSVRIKVNRKFNTFRNPWGSYHRKFVNIDDDNKLISIDLSGKIKEGKTGLNKKVLSQIKGEVLAAVSGNKLLINKKIKNLDLGTYLRPQIYRYYKHKYIFVADTDNNQIYAFDEQGKAIDKFPLAGKQVLDFKAGKNGKYLLIYDGSDNLIVYKF